jgi:hypothetical protein
MELFLNSAWALIAIGIVSLWLRLGPRTHAHRRLQFISLVMLITILFPVISVSDDLLSLHNPAETDTCQRRDHLASCPHSIFPPIAVLPEPLRAEPAFGFSRLLAVISLPLLTAETPALGPIQNRPPPSA